ncbi:enoyl-CoA hydratase/isomerase family protein [Chloroflexota bacterium]
MSYETITVEKKDYIALLTLNRPERLNAVTAKLCQEFMAAIDEIDKDDNARVLIITGAGRAFCSGADVQGMTGGSEATGDAGKGTDMQRAIVGPQMVQALQKMKKPTIGMVNGVAAGGGAALALACDIRMGCENSRFLNAFVKIGLASGWGGPWLYPRAMGLGKACEILFTGDFLEAQEADKIGVLNHLVPAAELKKETIALAKKIADGPPIAIGITKRQVYQGLGTNLDSALADADEAENITLTSEDHKEGVAAFREKRKPNFKGI